MASINPLLQATTSLINPPTSSLNNNFTESVVNNRLNSTIVSCVEKPNLISNKLLTNVENFTDPNWALNGMQNMEEIRRQGKLCDITLMANDYKFTAHRIVLAASIPYFNAMFLHEMAEKNKDIIHIKSVDHLCLEQFINYSYNGKITINNENVQSLLIGANFFHLKNIKTACCEFVKRRLTINDALTVRSFAEQLMCSDLIQSVDSFINRNFNKIMQTQEFFNLQPNELADILSRDELNVESEEQVYEALLKWVKNDELNNQKYFSDLIKCIRLPLLEPSYLIERVSSEKLVRSNLEVRDYLDQAYHFYILSEKRMQCSLKPRFCSDSFGLIYAIGGLNSSGGSVSTVEVYDCINDKWRLAESMMTTRSRVAVAVLQGKLFAIGGYNGLERLNTVECFDSETKKWKKVSSISKPRSALGSAVLNNKLYVCGGYDGSQSSDTVEVYNPKNDKWSIVSSMKKHRSASGICSFNSMIYAAGGHDGYRIFDSVEVYDTQKNEWFFVASMRTKRCRLGLSGLNGKLYAAGGYDSCNFLNSVERYDPIKNEWEYVASMNVKRSRMALVTCSSKLFAIGGYDGTYNLNSVEMYDPEKNQWTLVSSMIAHEGVVGVAVLGDNINEQNEQNNEYTIMNKNKFAPCTSSITHSTPFLSSNKPPLINNYYSLMEEEEEEYSTILSSNGGNQLQHN